MDVTSEQADVIARLCQPFDIREVKFKPQAVQGNRALAICYIDARAVQDRLDDVVGVDGWQDQYEVLPDGTVVCRLSVKLGGEWIVKMDVGGPSEQPDGGDRMKAAFSDALKRAAVKFGVGRYLYRVPNQWVDYDPQKKQFRTPPTLPAIALPARTKPAAAKAIDAPTAAPARAEPESTGERRGSGHPRTRTGAELEKRVIEYEAELIAAGLCRKYELLNFLSEAGQRAGFPAKLCDWPPGPAFDLAAKETRSFELKARKAVESARAADDAKKAPAKADTLHRVNAAIADFNAKVKTWKGALALIHVWPPQGFEEPGSDEELLSISEFLTEEKAQGLLTRLQSANRSPAAAGNNRS